MLLSVSLCLALHSPSRGSVGRSRFAPRASPVLSAKESLMTLGVPLTDTPRQQSAIAELVLELEKSNPTAAPARSAKLDGTWAVKFPAFFGPGIIDSPTRELALLLYTGGLKPGLLLQVLDKLPAFAAGACSVDKLSVTFSGAASGSPMAEGTLTGSVFSNPISFTLRSSLSPESDSRLRETYQEVTLLGRALPMPSSLILSRSLIVTYLDEDLMVIRDESGAAEVLERLGLSAPEGSSVPRERDDVKAEDQPSDLESAD